MHIIINPGNYLICGLPPNDSMISDTLDYRNYTCSTTKCIVKTRQLVTSLIYNIQIVYHIVGYF